jgi:glycosyltransferase involved in cell wall biosynthesis
VKRLAFVVQRCGLEVNGGSEKLCLDVARRLAGRADVEILTTCALDYRTWADHYPAGETEVAGVRTRRFPVERPRDLAAFDRLSARVHRRRRRLPDEEAEAWLRAQGPCSPALVDFLRAHRDEYDAFFFFTYLYATSYFGLPEVEGRAFLVPAAHDEWMLDFPLWERFFARPRGFLFLTPEERALVRSRFPALAPDGEVTGIGVDPPARTDAARFRRRFGIEGPFLLYLGRIEPAKGCDRLLADYARFRAARRQAPPLVLVGGAFMPIPEQPGVRALGFVDEETKWDALAACHALVMPSSYESLSIVLLEAWSVGRPVLVNQACAVLVGQTRRARGGLWYASGEEFAAALDRLLDPALAAQLGRQGQLHVRDEVSWERIVAAYLRCAGA